MLGDETREFLVAIGKAAHEKHQFRIGDCVQGAGVPVADTKTETADIHRVSGIRLLKRGEESAAASAPFVGVPPELEVYRQRGHRRLAARTYATKCAACIWGCEMPVEMIVDQWNPSPPRYRRETFCYGPKSCPFYSAGPTRKVPGRRGMSYEEENWVDEDATAHRGLED